MHERVELGCFSFLFDVEQRRREESPLAATAYGIIMLPTHEPVDEHIRLSRGGTGNVTNNIQIL